MNRRAKNIAIGAGVLIVLSVFLVAISGPTLTKADGGTVIVVRNGGPLDDTSVREVVQPNSSISWQGWHSVEHPYPASQRFFRVGPEGTADSQETINVVTKDGVPITVTGTWYFELNTDPKVLTAFDDKFGTRTFQVGENRYYAWEEEGWPAFLDTTFSTTAQNSSRQAVGGRACSDLVPSCLLVQAPQADAVSTEAIDAAASTSESALLTIQKEMAETFATEANQTLGENTIINVSFSLTSLTLPQSMQDAITAALNVRTDSNSKIAAAKATETQAQAEANANITRQQGYVLCPVCGEIDLRKAIPGGITVWAPGGDTAVAVPAPAPAPTSAPTPAPEG
jgi:regulator of protease activity HflC (stomatin/prohibitin superfamily)